MARLVASFALFVPALVAGLDNGLGLTPALGFNTWNAFGTQSKVLCFFQLLDGVRWRTRSAGRTAACTCSGHEWPRVPTCSNTVYALIA